MVVFNTGRPIRREAILPTDAHGAAPARVACRGQFNAAWRVKDAKAIACHRATALDVEQRRIPSVTDLTREKADAVSFHAGRERRIDDAESRVAEVGPISLGLQADHPATAPLPAITDLAADDASGSVAATVSNDCSSYPNEIHAV